MTAVIRFRRATLVRIAGKIIICLATYDISELLEICRQENKQVGACTDNSLISSGCGGDSGTVICCRSYTNCPTIATQDRSVALVGMISQSAIKGR
jgi:hypothetical protein